MQWTSAKSRTRLGVKVERYKCFGATSQGFETVLPINIVIGRNNVGKSTLMEMIELAARWRQSQSSVRHQALTFTTTLEEPDLMAGFPPSTSGGEVPGNHWEFAKQFVGKPFTWKTTLVTTAASTNVRYAAEEPPTTQGASGWQAVADKLGNPFDGAVFYKLAAARDVAPQELYDPSSRGGWQPDGSVVTALVNAFFNMASLPTEAVSQELLHEFNKIVAPPPFKALVPQLITDRLWELFLEEENKGRVALSASGAGYKTLLSTIALVDLMPRLQGCSLDRCIFALEELENNLHPALQRKLLAFVRDRAVNGGATFFLTTHSSVVIDTFEGDEAAQIVHVQHDGTNATATQVVTRRGRHQILDDLDVRASDLLQSNCIVWVEGPSDRRYFNRWIELCTAGQVREGTHYRCVFYGGKLLSHLGSGQDALREELVEILDINRHVVLIMDRDKSTPDVPINATKRRMCEEVTRSGGIAWVTAGREIENYIPPSVLGSMTTSPGLLQYDHFEPFAGTLSSLDPALSEVYSKSKVAFAERVCPKLTAAALRSHLDLGQKIHEVVDKISEWNALQPGVWCNDAGQ